ncbi:hypothetical protein Syun_027320 [Stephania yunnanensis]|uniref:Uncharacterized protein n=1 Tax=Stephania yunnanensis TaxID=152371 RepID=A0AAP0EP90_9MAGN
MESMKSCEEPRHMAYAHSEDSVSSKSHERNSDAQPTSSPWPSIGLNSKIPFLKDRNLAKIYTFRLLHEQSIESSSFVRDTPRCPPLLCLLGIGRSACACPHQRRSRRATAPSCCCSSARLRALLCTSLLAGLPRHCEPPYSLITSTSSVLLTSIGAYNRSTAAMSRWTCSHPSSPRAGALPHSLVLLSRPSSTPAAPMSRTTTCVVSSRSRSSHCLRSLSLSIAGTFVPSRW